MVRRRLLDPMMVRPCLGSCGPRWLGGHKRPGERKFPQHGAVPVQRIVLERKGPQRDGPRHVRAMGTKRKGIIQSRHRLGWRWEDEIERPANHSSFPIELPRTQLAAEEEGGPPLIR